MIFIFLRSVMISFGNVAVEYKVDISKVKFFFQMVNKYRYKKLEIRIISSPPPPLDLRMSKYHLIYRQFLVNFKYHLIDNIQYQYHHSFINYM